MLMHLEWWSTKLVLESIFNEKKIIQEQVLLDLFLLIINMF